MCFVMEGGQTRDESKDGANRPREGAISRSNHAEGRAVPPRRQCAPTRLTLGLNQSTCRDCGEMAGCVLGLLGGKRPLGHWVVNRLAGNTTAGEGGDRLRVAAGCGAPSSWGRWKSQLALAGSLEMRVWSRVWRCLGTPTACTASGVATFRPNPGPIHRRQHAATHAPVTPCSSLHGLAPTPIQHSRSWYTTRRRRVRLGATGGRAPGGQQAVTTVHGPLRSGAWSTAGSGRAGIRHPSPNPIHPTQLK